MFCVYKVKFVMASEARQRAALRGVKTRLRAIEVGKPIIRRPRTVAGQQIIDTQFGGTRNSHSFIAHLETVKKNNNIHLFFEDGVVRIGVQQNVHWRRTRKATDLPSMGQSFRVSYVRSSENAVWNGQLNPLDPDTVIEVVFATPPENGIVTVSVNGRHRQRMCSGIARCIVNEKSLKYT